jgi:hypothetical protein
VVEKRGCIVTAVTPEGEVIVRASAFGDDLKNIADEPEAQWEPARKTH